MTPVFPALWLSLRGVYALLGLALVLGLASALPALAGIALCVAVALAAALGVDARSGPSRATLCVARQPLPLLALGRPATLGYAVENRAASALWLGISETPVPAIAFASPVCAARLGPHAGALLELACRANAAARVSARYTFARKRALGLLQWRYRVEAADEARVFPDLSAVRSYGALAKRSTLLEAGLRRRRSRGTGTEFESLREYQPGDGFKSVDWKATAHRGRMMVAQYEVERSQTMLLALDCGRTMTPHIGASRKFDYALTAALSVARVAQNAGDNVGLLAFAAAPLVSIAPRRGAAHASALARATFALQPRSEEPDYETAFSALRRRHSKRSLVVLFTDIVDPVTSAAVLAGLATLVPRHLVLCVLMNDAALAAALDEEPAGVAAAYRTAVAMTLADERADAIALMRARGIIVVDVAAAKLTLGLLDAYLDVKARGRL